MTRNITSRELAKLGIKLPGSASAQAANAKRVQKCGAYDSKTEAAYADRLALMLAAKEIRLWIHHPFSLLLDNEPGKKPTRYTPDFLVEYIDGAIEIVEVKGFQRSRDVVRWKWAASRFGCFRWIMVQREGRCGWHVVRRAGRCTIEAQTQE